MSNSNNDGCFVSVLWIGTIAISIGSGILAWKWIKPESFLGAIFFLIVWGIMSKIGHLIALGIVALLHGDN